MPAHGSQIVADFWGCRLPADESAWRQVLLAAIDAMGVTLLHLHIHLFEPRGATAIALLAESHLAIHTWPEGDYLAIDIFTCGTALRPEAGIDSLRQSLAPTREEVRHISRGDHRVHRPVATIDPHTHDRERPCP